MITKKLIQFYIFTAQTEKTFFQNLHLNYKLFNFHDNCLFFLIVY